MNHKWERGRQERSSVQKKERKKYAGKNISGAKNEDKIRTKMSETRRRLCGGEMCKKKSTFPVAEHRIREGLTGLIHAQLL